MAASGEDNSAKGPQGEWLPHGEDNHRTNPQGENCIAARTPINGPRGATLPVMEEQDVRIAPLGGHPSMAGGRGGGGGKMPVLEEQMSKMHHCEDAHQRPTGGKDGL